MRAVVSGGRYLRSPVHFYDKEKNIVISVRKLAIISTILEATGVALMLLVMVSMNFTQTAAARPIAPTSVTIKKQVFEKRTIHGTPVHVSVPSLGISAGVKKGYYDADQRRWTISEHSAYFATTTNEVNDNSGNTLIYAHNSTWMFGPLHSVQMGAKAVVRTANGYEFTYRLIDVRHVEPTNLDAISKNHKPLLILQTCSGWFNQTRQLSYFELDSYKEVN